MPLVTLQTNLKSLKFGDYVGGDNGQPYEIVPIPGVNEQIPPSSQDFLFRGGARGIADTVTDVRRLGKFLDNKDSPNGILFTAKQNLLSRIGVRTQASGVGLNEGVYNPLNTLAQAGISLEGYHIPKQGLVPFRGPNTYLDTLQEKDPLFGQNKIISIENNRLVQLTQIKIDGDEGLTERINKRGKIKINKPLLNQNQISSRPTEILAYGGGPNSIVGIGKTRVPFATDRYGAPLRTGIGNNFLQNSGFFPPAPVSPPESNTDLDFLDNDPGILGSPNFNFNPGGRDENAREKVKNELHGFDVFKGEDNTITDFREEIYKISTQKQSFVTGIAPSYDAAKNKTIDGPAGSRIHYKSPGQKGNVINYTLGKLDPVTNQPIGAVDEINAQPIYQSRAVRQDKNVKKNDLVKFRIAAINSENPNKKEFIHFRAFIDSFSDQYNGTWTPQQYMGRGEALYNYNNFKRDINLSFTIAAQSRPEIMEQYRKLNFLVSNLAPDYTSAGYLAGPLIQLTMGGWCYELPGFINSLTLDIPQESTWEIAIPSSEAFRDQANPIYSDNSVKEMPHICKVTGFSFTPIHNFRPSKQQLTFGGPGNEVTKYGNERYLALSNGLNNNYDKRPKV